MHWRELLVDGLWYHFIHHSVNDHTASFWQPTSSLTRLRWRWWTLHHTFEGVFCKGITQRIISHSYGRLWQTFEFNWLQRLRLCWAQNEATLIDRYQHYDIRIVYQFRHTRNPSSCAFPPFTVQCERRIKLDLAYVWHAAITRYLLTVESQSTFKCWTSILAHLHYNQLLDQASLRLPWVKTFQECSFFGNSRGKFFNICLR